MAQQKEKAAAVRGVIYARYSSSGQREESIEGQLRDCRDYARQNGISIIAEYCDRALTGTSDKRPEFQRMIRDSSRGQFEIVLCWKNDRFARNRYDSAIYKTQLSKNGVRIVYAKEAIPEGPEGIILEALMEGFAEYYSANLSQNIRRGNYDSALKRQTLGVRVFGLREGADKRFEPDPATAPVVRRIFEDYAAGRSTVDIVSQLNAEGYRTSRGNLFNKNSLRWILSNEKYIGIYTYKDQIRDEKGIPPIVDRDLFEKANRMMRRHHEAPAAKREEGGFLLTGKLWCGECGTPMTADCGTGKSGRTYSYYMCNGRRKKNGCKKERAPKQWIEDTIVSRLLEIVYSDAMVEEIADRFVAWQATQKADTTVLDGLTARLKETEKAIRNNLDLVNAGVITDSVRSNLLQLEDTRVSLEAGIAKEKLNNSVPLITRSEICLFLTSFRDGDPDDPHFRIFLVDTFLKAAYLYDDHRLIMHLNFTGDNSQVDIRLAEQAVTEGEKLCSKAEQLTVPNSANSNTAVFWFHGILAAFSFVTK